MSLIFLLEYQIGLVNTRNRGNADLLSSISSSYDIVLCELSLLKRKILN